MKAISPLLHHYSAPTFLMCRPDFYAIEYEINPWMNKRRGVDRVVAIKQWEQLHATLTQTLGALVELVAAVAHQPDMIFTANAGLVVGQRVFLSNFRHKERHGEAAHYRRWFEANGYEIVTLPKRHSFEGEGDALFLGQRLFAGYQFRTDLFAHEFLRERLGTDVISLELTDPRFYHLDTCFCPLRTDLAAYYPAAFNESTRHILAAKVKSLIEISEVNAMRFAANAIVLGSEVILNTGCNRFAHALQDHGFRVHAVDLSQFLRAGGSAKCLVLDMSA